MRLRCDGMRCIEPAAVSRHLWPYLALMLVFTLLIAFVPGIVMFLPRLMGY